MFAQGKLARLVVIMSPCIGPKLTSLSRLPWTIRKMGAKSNEMSHAPANTALSWPKSNFKAMEAVPAPAHNSITDTPGGKLIKDATVSRQTESVLPTEAGCPETAVPPPCWRAAGCGWPSLHDAQDVHGGMIKGECA